MYFRLYTRKNEKSEYVTSHAAKITMHRSILFSTNNYWRFSYFSGKHILWVLIRSASARRFWSVPTIYEIYDEYPQYMKNTLSWYTFYLELHYVEIFWFGFYGPFKNISLISSRSFIEGGRKPENPEKNHLTIRKQNLAFPHMTRARLEPQRWET